MLDWIKRYEIGNKQQNRKPSKLEGKFMLRVTEKIIKVVCGLQFVLHLLKVNNKDFTALPVETILVFCY